MVTAMVPVELSAAAAESAWVSRVVAFTRWVGAGRKLTQTGRVTLAHARELVELLGTGDVIDPKIGDQVFRTKSSEELPELNAVVEWAKASRLVRVSGGKLVVAKKNASLLERPLPLWRQMFEMFGKLGSAVCPSGWGESLLRHHFDEGIGAVLAGVYAHGRPVEVMEVCAWAWKTVSAGYRIEDATDAQQATLRQCNDRDVRRALGVLAQFGAVRLAGDDTAQSVALTPLGRWAMGRGLGEPEPGDPIFQVKITLLETAAPVVWRRMLVPAGVRLDRLHRLVQAVMGWQDYHMHVFSDGTTMYGSADPELDYHDEHAVTLGDLVKGEGDQIGYTYDFGDDWEHEITVEKATAAEPGMRYPVVMAGGGACPPEDCGGVWGYQHLREVMADPSHDEHGSMLEWLGLANASDFDPAGFDVDQANRALAEATARR
jgi:hypothetical protein